MTASETCKEVSEGWFRKCSKMKVQEISFKEKQKNKKMPFFFLIPLLYDLLLLNSVGKTEQEAI